MPVQFSPLLMNSPAFQLAVEGMLWLKKSGLLVHTPDFRRSSVLWSSDAGVPVSVICLRLDGPVAVVELAYTEPSHRRMGHFSLLMEAASGHAKKHGCTQLVLTVSPEKEDVLDAVEAVGLSNVGLLYGLEV